MFSKILNEISIWDDPLLHVFMYFFLPQAAAFGKSFVQNMKADSFVDKAKTIRVLNNVRDYKIGMPITYDQYLFKMFIFHKWIKVFCLSRPYHLQFFKRCLPQILLGPFLNILTQMLFFFYLTVFVKGLP